MFEECVKALLFMDLFGDLIHFTEELLAHSWLFDITRSLRGITLFRHVKVADLHR